MTEYHKEEGVSSHMLIEMMRSPFHCYEKYLAPNRAEDEPTPSLILGSAVHSLVLTPSSFNEEFVVFEGEKRSNAQKKKYKELLETGKTVLPAKLMKQAQRIADAVKANSTASHCLSNGDPEFEIFVEREGRLRLKGKIDFVDFEKRHIYELKTTCDASPDAFARDIARYSYHISAAYYDMLVKRTAAKYDREWKHIFIVVENKPPYAVAIYETSKKMLLRGHELWWKALERFDECWKQNFWNGFSTYPITIELPKWAVGDELDETIAIGELF